MAAAYWRSITGTRTLMAAAEDNIGVSNAAAAAVVVTKEWTARDSSSVSPSSNLGKFLGIPKASRSSTDHLLSTFIKFHNKQNPAMRMDMLSLEQMKSLVEREQRVGFPEMTKLMSS